MEWCLIFTLTKKHFLVYNKVTLSSEIKNMVCFKCLEPYTDIALIVGVFFETSHFIANFLFFRSILLETDNVLYFD
jgi:hypothetical protein